MKVKIKRLSDKAVIPKQGSKHAAGFDLVATSKEEVMIEGALSYINYGTDIAVEIPVGFVGYIFPRSSVSNKGLSLANSVGVIDSDYRGPVSVRMYAASVGKEEDYVVGDRIAQLIIMPIPDTEFVEVKELSDTHRGEGSYGSTGK